jgi:hypothetical protein
MSMRLWIIAAGLLAIGGCGGGSGGGGGGEVADPTLEAVDAASDAIQSLAQASVVSQAPVDVRATQAAGAFTFGTCPVVSGTTVAPGDVTVNFGGACAAAPDYFCTGTASGQFDGAAGRLGLLFNDVTCGNHTLTGNVDLQATPLPTGADMIGQWNLTSAIGQELSSVVGTGESIYDRDLSTANLTSFTGQITEPPQQYTITLENVQISVINNAALVPASGSAIVTGGPNGPITITFGPDSPVSGDVQVSTGDGAVQTVNLFMLPQGFESTP